MGELDPAALVSPWGSTPAMEPLACAVAVLPVVDARALLLPGSPFLAPLLDSTDGLLGEVIRLENCKECVKLERDILAVPPGGKKAAKRRKALEVHRRGH